MGMLLSKGFDSFGYESFEVVLKNAEHVVAVVLRYPFPVGLVHGGEFLGLSVFFWHQPYGGGARTEARVDRFGQELRPYFSRSF